MRDIRFYGEGKGEYDTQMFLSEEGVFFWGTRKGLVECYRELYPLRHLMVYLYSREEYERNRKAEEDRANLVKFRDKWNVSGKMAGDTFYTYASEGNAARRELGFDFTKDNGIER